MVGANQKSTLISNINELRAKKIKKLALVKSAIIYILNL
jgi:hypothetical protein